MQVFSIKLKKPDTSIRIYKMLMLIELLKANPKKEK